MDNNPQTRSILGGVVVASGVLASMLSQMHGCDLQSLWIEVPLFLCFITLVPAWTRRASTLRLLIWRFVGAVIFIVGIELGYLSWLHSNYFPSALLFPKPRMHHRMP